MLFGIIAEDHSLKWHEIAKFLFQRSDKTYLRGSKQCRERWLNHLDPNKTKKNWTIPEYLIVFQCVESKGKKWARMVHKLNDKRSEHTIKNKYNSIIRKKLRISPELRENKARKDIISRLKQIIDHETVNSEDEFIFGDPAKRMKQASGSGTNGLGGNDETPQKVKKKMKAFRKKIEKF